MAMTDPHAALERLVEIFCAFWSRDSAVGRLHDAMATDPEFAAALVERNERRRKAVGTLVGRMAGKVTSRRSRQDAIDLIFALTSYAMFAMLSKSRSAGEVRALVKSACRGVLQSLLPERPAAPSFRGDSPFGRPGMIKRIGPKARRD
jgi:hypothetical protein